MRLIRGLYNCPSELFVQGCVATIGNFDGVHLGHQAIIKRLTTKAKALNLPSLVVLFEPHPQEFFRKDEAPARLFKLTDKLQALDALGVENVLCFRFNQEFAELSAEDFIETVLLKRLQLKHLFIGDDFRFGFQRKGDFSLLQSYAERGDFAVEANHSVTSEVAEQAVRISSSQVRDAIVTSDFSLAKQLLGSHYRVSGKVVHGDKQGRLIGTPTANIALKRRKSPLKGVYAVRVYGISASSRNELDNAPLYGVANVGVKPTLNRSAARLEVHLLDFAQEIYGQRLSVEPIAKLRDEQKFESVEQLTQQIKQDINRAKKVFSAHNKTNLRN